VNWLIADPGVAAAYQVLKEALARRHHADAPAYPAGKPTFFGGPSVTPDRLRDCPRKPTGRVADIDSSLATRAGIRTR